ncbi:hypothetical protein L2E82_01357 [Cichorium intybus]|uniref:Uncharacterized protein n=1 Tax=Cichorium intybus TaxID=13427 RepID=A0ACB9GZD4_CICIN|nr:hypothetical protein L2E82_01357 [Cichorium intybus]
MKEKGKMEIHNHVINPRSCEDRYLLLANNIAIQGHPAVGLELDLAELEDQLTHQVYKSDPEIALDIFKMDPNFLENENKYQDLKKTILGDDLKKKKKKQKQTLLHDKMSASGFDDCPGCQVGHKLLKIKLEPGQENDNGAEDTPTLIDRKDNVFIISNFKSKYPVLQLDLRLISDLVVVIGSATCGGIAFACAGQPAAYLVTLRVFYKE